MKQRILRPVLTCETRCYLRGVLSNCCQKVLEDSMFCFDLCSFVLNCCSPHFWSLFWACRKLKAGVCERLSKPRPRTPSKMKSLEHRCLNLSLTWNLSLTFSCTILSTLNRRCRELSVPVMCWAQSLERIRRHVLNAVTKITLDCFESE